MKIINLISGPRNLSTALMYSFSQRPDTVVIDEPFYAHYLVTTGIDHPSRQETINSMSSNINEILSNKILVYPNPSSGKFNIDLDGVDLIGSKLDIINSLGKVIYKDLLDENNFHIDLKSNSKGVYLIRIENNDNILIKKLTIK